MAGIMHKTWLYDLLVLTKDNAIICLSKMLLLFYVSQIWEISQNVVLGNWKLSLDAYDFGLVFWHKIVLALIAINVIMWAEIPGHDTFSYNCQWYWKQNVHLKNEQRKIFQVKLSFIW